MLSIRKTLNLRLGVFFVCYFCHSYLALANDDCAMDVSRLTKAQLANVVDGDTIKLTNGEKLRLIGVNTPELSAANKMSALLAHQAKRAVKSFFMGQKDIYLVAGIEKNDHYGRQLAHVYRGDGSNLSAMLLSQGLAWQVIVPPNIAFVDCYAQIEQQAKQQKLGVWAEGMPVLAAAQLDEQGTGFQIVEGTVSKVSKSKNTWWLSMGRVAISISAEDSQHFSDKNFHRLLNTKLRLKGWVIDRSASKWVLKNGYPPYMMHWQHPLMEIRGW